MTQVAHINKALSAYIHQRNADHLQHVLCSFIQSQTKPSSTLPKIQDDFSALVEVVPLVLDNYDLLSSVAAVFRILSRRTPNRTDLKSSVLAAVVSILRFSATNRLVPIATDVAFVIVNVSVTQEHCIACVDAVLSLVACCEIQDSELQYAACAALQALCSVRLCVDAFQFYGGAPAVVPLLLSGDSRVVNAALGALHNATADLNVCEEVMICGGLSIVLLLLTEQRTAKEVANAAGTIQNLSRHKDCAPVLRESGAAQLLLRLLGAWSGGAAGTPTEGTEAGWEGKRADDVWVETSLQVTVIGALLNLAPSDDALSAAVVTPEAAARRAGMARERRALKEIMSLVVAAGAVGRSLDEAGS